MARACEVIGLSPPRRAAVQRVSLPLLVFVSATMIVLGKADQILFESLRASVTDTAAPALDVLSRPVAALGHLVDRARDFVAVYQDNARLAEENERLLTWQQAALGLASENARLRELLKLTPEPPATFITARVIANSGGAYVRSLMVYAGHENGVVRGQAAMTGEGLVGRVSEVGSRAARVLLVTDLNSRVPVIVEGPQQRALLAGDNSERPNLRYLDAGTGIKIGDRVVTSGQGGVFPPGLPVGIVASVDGEAPRVEPYVEMSRVEYLRIVDYGLANGLPNPVPVASRSGRRADASTGDQPGRR
ncbi:MAG TPA: rod shape-determining protein MreC [Stellaceae bacterium]|nr:rod shape-determining protein MreC [Stellaceae bacterium]HMD65603.1 rod shape-determining protein MreC [Stellaceae bacterium]